MQRPPPKKPKTPDDLAEVERALSVLKGRNPEFERARREDEEARAQRPRAEGAGEEDADRPEEGGERIGADPAELGRRRLLQALLLLALETDEEADAEGDAQPAERFLKPHAFSIAMERPAVNPSLTAVLPAGRSPPLSVR